jgi:hypothetical protein
MRHNTRILYYTFDCPKGIQDKSPTRFAQDLLDAVTDTLMMHVKGQTACHSLTQIRAAKKEIRLNAGIV